MKNSRRIFWPPAQLMEATLTLRYRRLPVQGKKRIDEGKQEKHKAAISGP
jgi:hypothetical protein